MRWLKGASAPILILLMWEAGSRAGILAEGTFSRPSEIAVAGVSIIGDGSLALATYQTLQAAFAGLLLALALGIPLGLLLGRSSIAKLTVSPTLEVVRPVPPVALIPLSLLVFGFGVWMEAAVVAFASVWSISIATTAAVRAIEGRLLEVARTLELSPLECLLKIVIPAAFARIAVGIRVAVGIALVVAVTVEIVVNPRGLGYGIIISQQSLRPDVMYAQLLWIGVVGWSINAALTAFDRHFLWRFGVVRR
jgi:ABC-type nitrate/sulfonate/bicarbonate transport system permease component